MGRSVARSRCTHHPADVGARIPQQWGALGGRVGLDIDTRIGMAALYPHAEGVSAKRAIHGP